MGIIITKVIVLQFFNLTNISPLAKTTAPVPNGGMTTSISAPDPVNPGPRIPSIASISIV